MREFPTIIVRKTANGFTAAKDEGTGRTPSESVFSFESFTSLSRHLASNLCERSPGYYGARNTEGVHGNEYDVTQDLEGMRDELGELRRYKEQSHKETEVLRKRLGETLDTLNSERSRHSNTMVLLDQTREKLVKSEALLNRRSKRQSGKKSTAG